MKKSGRAVLSMLLALCLLFSTTGSALAATSAYSVESTTELKSLKVNYQEAPIGIGTDNLRFSWQMESDLLGISQKSYRIVVATESGSTIWDSGTVESGLSSAIPYGGDTDAFAPETCYTWTVTVTDNYGGVHTASSTFETGTDWDNAQWITSQGWTTFYYETSTFTTNWGDKTMDRPVSGSNAPLFRTEQKLSGKTVEKARLYITSLGVYEAYINGRQVQNEVNSIMSPGYTDYGNYVNYQTYDVTDYITGDTLALSAVVSTGWYGDVIGEKCGYEEAIGQEELRERALYADLVITYTDGTQQTIVTDESWTATDDSPFESSGIYYNVNYNNQRAAELEGWTEPGFEKETWQQAVSLGQANCEVRPNNSTMIYEQESHPFVSAKVYDAQWNLVASYAAGEQLTLKADQTLVLDFGQNASHMPEFTVSGEAGAKLFLQPGEYLSEDGSIPVEKATRYRNFQYTLAGQDAEHYKNEHSFVGYQYLAVTTSADVTFDSFESIAVSSLTSETGSVETSNALINQFVCNSKWSQLSNYCAVPTDCPTREYLGWSGDAQLFCESGMFHYDCAAFLESYIEIMNDFFDDRGYYGDVMPYMAYCGGEKGQTCAWGDAGIILPYYYYLQTGDTTLITKYWSQMSEIVNRVFDDTVLGDDYVSGYSGVKFGDWLALQASGYTFLTASFLIYTNDLMAEMAEIIGEDGSQFAQQAETVRRYTIDRFIDEEGNVLCATKDSGTRFQTPADNAQTAIAWALKLGLYDTEAQYNGMKKNLAASVENKDGSYRSNYGTYTIATGFPGVNILLPALSESGETETAYGLMNSTNLGSFLYSVTQGSTAIWESWTGSGSRNHYSYGAASEWLYEYVLGIQKDEESAGFKHFILQPEMDASMDYATGSYDSYYGKIGSAWTAENGVLTSYKAVVPANTSATLYLPVGEKQVVVPSELTAYVQNLGTETHNGQLCAVLELASGSYTFTAGETVTVAAEESCVSATVTLELNGNEAATLSDKALTYTVSASNTDRLATVSLTFRVEGLTKVSVKPAEGWYEISNSLQDGVLTVVIGSTEGLTDDNAAELLTLLADNPDKVGEVSITLTDAVLSAYAGEGETFLPAAYGNTMVTTTVDYSIFDVNMDGVVNQLDITRAQRAFGAVAGDSNWNARADIDGNGKVDIGDFILILRNYTV